MKILKTTKMKIRELDEQLERAYRDHLIATERLRNFKFSEIPFDKVEISKHN